MTDEAPDPRLATQGYETSRAACADLDEAERIRYLYVERQLLLKFLDSDQADDPDMPATLRAVAHDEAIRQVAAVRALNGDARVKVRWDDVNQKGG
jgi:hypothetical protein